MKQIVTTLQEQRMLDNIEAGRSCPACGSRDCSDMEHPDKFGNAIWICRGCGHADIVVCFKDNPPLDDVPFSPIQELEDAIVLHDIEKIAAWLRANISEDTLRRVLPGPSWPYIEARNDHEANGRYEG